MWQKGRKGSCEVFKKSKENGQPYQAFDQEKKEGTQAKSL